MKHCGGRIQARLENRRSEHYCIVGSHSTLCLVILSASSSTCIFTNKPRTIERDEAQTEGAGRICVFVYSSVSLSELNLTLHLNNLTEGVSSKGPEPVTRNNPQAGCGFLLPLQTSLHPSIRPTPSLACKSNPHAAQCSAPESVSDTSGGRKSNLFD